MGELFSLLDAWDTLGWYFSTYLPGWGNSMISLEWQAYGIG